MELFSARTKLSYNKCFCGKILIDKPVHWGLSILEISKIVLYEFWYDYLKQKYGEKAKLRCMDTDIFIVYITIADIYVHISKDVETRFDSSNYELGRSLPKGKNRLMKDKLGRKIMTDFAALIPKTYSYLTDDSDQNKKAKGTKSVP